VDSFIACSWPRGNLLARDFHFYFNFYSYSYFHFYFHFCSLPARLAKQQQQTTGHTKPMEEPRFQSGGQNKRQKVGLASFGAALARRAHENEELASAEKEEEELAKWRLFNST